MELLVTSSSLAAAVGLILLMSWRERRPRTTLHVPLIPTTPVIFVSMFVALMALVHLATILR